MSSVVSHPSFINDQKFTSPPGRAKSFPALLLSVMLKDLAVANPCMLYGEFSLSLQWFLLLGSR